MRRARPVIGSNDVWHYRSQHQVPKRVGVRAPTRRDVRWSRRTARRPPARRTHRPRPQRFAAVDGVSTTPRVVDRAPLAQRARFRRAVRGTTPRPNAASGVVPIATTRTVTTRPDPGAPRTRRRCSCRWWNASTGQVRGSLERARGGAVRRARSTGRRARSSSRTKLRSPRDACSPSAASPSRASASNSACARDHVRRRSTGATSERSAVAARRRRAARRRKTRPGSPGRRPARTPISPRRHRRAAGPRRTRGAEIAIGARR